MKSATLIVLLLPTVVLTQLARGDDKNKDQTPTYSQISLQISRSADTLMDIHPSVQPFINADVSGTKPLDDSAAARQSASMSAKVDISETALKISMPIYQQSKTAPISQSDFDGFMQDLTHTGGTQLPNDTIRNIYEREAQNVSTAGVADTGDTDHPVVVNSSADPRAVALGRFIKVMDDSKEFFQKGVDALAPLLTSATTPNSPSPSKSKFSQSPYMPTPFGYMGFPPPPKQGGGGGSGGGGGGSGGAGSSSNPGGGAGAPTAGVQAQLSASRSGEKDNQQGLAAASGPGVSDAASALPQQAIRSSGFTPGSAVADNAALYNPESILEGKPSFRYAPEGGFELGKGLSSTGSNGAGPGNTATASAKKSTTGGGRSTSVYNGKAATAPPKGPDVFNLSGAYPPFEAPFNFNRDSGFAKGGAAVGDTIITDGTGGAGAEKGRRRLSGALQNQVITTPPEDSVTGHRWLLSFVGYTRHLCGESQFALPICPTPQVAPPREMPRQLAIQADDAPRARVPASVWR